MEKEYVHLYSTIIAGLVSALNLKKKSDGAPKL